MLSALAGVTELRVKQGHLESALALASLVIHHPWTEYVHKELMERLVAELQDRLSAEVVAEALERGKVMDLENVVEGILRQSSLKS